MPSLTLDQLLVTTDWLAARLDHSALRVVDMRGHVIPASEPLPHYFNHHDAYVESHLPGAVFLDWVKAITDPDDPHHAQIAKPERFAAAMNERGIDSETAVVVYDDARGMFAARLWWALNYYGHTNVAVLDGGWEKWTAENRPVTADVPQIAPTHFIPTINPTLRRTADDVEGKLRVQHLFDVRTPDEFNGKSSRARRSGHIPGAVNLPRIQLTNNDSTMISPEALRQQFISFGVDDESEDIVFYCNGGVSASYGLLASRVAGLVNGSLYDGSWKDWGNDESKPIE